MHVLRVNLLAVAIAVLLAGCAHPPKTQSTSKDKPTAASTADKRGESANDGQPSVRVITARAGKGRQDNQTDPNPPRAASYLGQQVAMYALGLLEIGYTFGGKNPEAGLDCSGLVSYVFKEAIHMPMTGNAATIATRGRPIKLDDIRTGDLVFFNTTGKPYSHVGIYIGNHHFIHAPNSRGRVRIQKLNEGYYRKRFQEARSYFND